MISLLTKLEVLNYAMFYRLIQMSQMVVTTATKGNKLEDEIKTKQRKTNQIRKTTIRQQQQQQQKDGSGRHGFYKEIKEIHSDW